jgi:6-pyruvoyltetrahydropterin/6-carboxytetrahydropterin synthase
MYKVAVEGHFDAAHSLRNYQGKCESLHGHRYRVLVKIESEMLNEIGISYDFAQLKKDLGAVLNNYDHKLLNDLSPFGKINPSTENIARTIYETFESIVTTKSFILKSVTVWESPDASVEYCK